MFFRCRPIACMMAEVGSQRDARARFSIGVRRRTGGTNGMCAGLSAWRVIQTSLEGPPAHLDRPLHNDRTRRGPPKFARMGMWGVGYDTISGDGVGRPVAMAHLLQLQ